ncbi:L-alanine exporter AlaE [Neisseriaceae bacterium ESL0693]|nr:L-alanine exporter AlaE [Neisseriaceae bacterium ESL0693]
MKILFSTRKNNLHAIGYPPKRHSIQYRQILADMLAMVVFCTFTNFLVEVFISHMTVQQSLYARIMAIPVNALVAVPYGYYRDFWLRFRICARPLVNLLVNIFAYTTFLTPVYIMILICSGASEAQIITAAVLNVLVSMVTGGIYGHFMNYCRCLLHAGVSVHH